VHRFADRAGNLILREKADIAIVDETAVNVGGRQVWLWIAIEPEHRAVLAVTVTETRNVLVAYAYSKACATAG